MRSWRLYWVRHQVPEQSKGYEFRPCLQNERNRGRKRGGEKRVEGGKGKENKCTWYKNRKNFMPNIILSLNSRVRITIIVHTFFFPNYTSVSWQDNLSVWMFFPVCILDSRHIRKRPRPCLKLLELAWSLSHPSPMPELFWRRMFPSGHVILSRNLSISRFWGVKCKFIIKKGRHLFRYNLKNDFQK